MTVQLRIPCSLRKFVDGRSELALPSGDGAQLFSYLAEYHGELYRAIHRPGGGMQPFVRIFANQAELSGADPAACRLRPGDVVTIVSAIAGG